MVASLSDVYRAVEPDLLLVEAEIRQAVQTLTPRLADAASYFLHQSGKRMRPMVTVLAAKLGNADNNAVCKMAAALELVHLGSLVHDDVVDESVMRRGRQSVNARFGNQVAVLLGDFFFSCALSVARSIGLDAVQVIAGVISHLVEGELAQLERCFDTEVTVDDYFARITQKTAWFLAECCRAGGLFSPGNPLTQEELHAFGLNLGLAFQVKDDLLDFTGLQATVGKPTLWDLQAGVITLPVIHVLAHHPRRAEISTWIQSRELDKDELIRSCLHEAGSLLFAEQRAAELVATAKRQLDRVPEHEVKAALLLLADFVLARVS